MRVHLYGDESGNFDFSAGAGASRFFILTTVAFFDDRAACKSLEELRYELAWAGVGHPGPFHATTDEQMIRDSVFERLRPHGFRVDSTIFEKRKALPATRQSDERFYRFAWYYHAKHVIPALVEPSDELLLVAASLGEKARRRAFHAGVNSVMQQVAGGLNYETTHWSSAIDTGLQIADYCSWAIQRKWERSDSRSYALIEDKIQSEYDIFRSSDKSYY